MTFCRPENLDLLKTYNLLIGSFMNLKNTTIKISLATKLAQFSPNRHCSLSIAVCITNDLWFVKLSIAFNLQ